jgi:uncharacterized spore protein YtfJ
MDFLDTLSSARDAVTVKRVYGEPYERNGVTVIPAASVLGGGGGGGGTEPNGEEGSGLGFGLRGRPVGAYVIRGEQVSWEPALDVTRLAVGAQLLALAALVLIGLGRRRR